MVRIRTRGEEIRRFILENIDQHPTDISKLVADRFQISRQAVNLHLKRLVAEHALAPTNGHMRNRSYKLAPLVEWRRVYEIGRGLEEDVVWRTDISLVLGEQPDNISEIWHYAFTEMFNNAIEHSGGTIIHVGIKKTAVATEIAIRDNGVGIFKKIQLAMNFLDERHAVLELSKGKLTTDPKGHTGEGIFFTSRILDSFDILSGGVYFLHRFGQVQDWALENEELPGTFVWMKLNNHTSRTFKKEADKYVSEDGDFGFSKTVVPVELARYGNEKLISRSQAKRVLARVDLFKTVMFDFTGVDTIGQAFADEIFRVFHKEHPDIGLFPINTNAEIKGMIQRVQAAESPLDSMPMLPFNQGK